MKSAVFISLLLLIFSYSEGQIQKNALSSISQIGFNQTDQTIHAAAARDYEKSSGGFSLGQKIAYFVSNKTALGLSCNFAHRSESFDSRLISQVYGESYFFEVDSKFNLYEHRFGILIRKTFSLTKGLYVFIEPSIFYGFSDSKRTYSEVLYTDTPPVYYGPQFSKSESLIYGASVNPGLIYYPKSWIGVELSVGRIEYSNIYNNNENGSEGSSYSSYKSDSHFDNFVADFSFSSFALGVNFLFNNSPVNSQDN